jgi:hypothetical protein
VIVLPLALATILAALTIWTGMHGLVRLAHLPLQRPVYAVLACAAQLPNVIGHTNRSEWVVLSLGLIGVFCWQNRALPGMRLIVCGIVLNAAVILSNNGSMPVAPAALAQVHGTAVTADLPLQWSKANVMDDTTARLAWLGDRFVLPAPFPPLAAWSLGDVFLLLGVGRLLLVTMTRGRVHELAIA